LLSEQEGADSDDGDACPMYHGGEPVGPWLVNTKTGWSHRTVSGSDAGVVSDVLRCTFGSCQDERLLREKFKGGNSFVQLLWPSPFLWQIIHV